jgi:hypothetical protein
MMDSPETPSASETTGPTCSAIRSWIRAGPSVRELCAASERASRLVSGSMSRLVGVRGGTITRTPSPRSSRWQSYQPTPEASNASRNIAYTASRISRRSGSMRPWPANEATSAKKIVQF